MSTMLPPGTVAVMPKLVPGPCRRFVFEMTRAGAAEAASAASTTNAPTASVATLRILADPIMTSSCAWPPFRRGSGHRSPRAVGMAAGRPARRLRLTIDIDGVSVLPTRHRIALIGRARNHGAIAAGIIVAPADRRSRRAAVERLHLRLVGASALLIVERGADAIADQPANRRAGDGARHAATAATELRADHSAGYGTDQRAGVLLRPCPGVGISRAGGQRESHQCDDACATQGHAPPPSASAPA